MREWVKRNSDARHKNIADAQTIRSGMPGAFKSFNTECVGVGEDYKKENPGAPLAVSSASVATQRIFSVTTSPKNKIDFAIDQSGTKILVSGAVDRTIDLAFDESGVLLYRLSDGSLGDAAKVAEEVLCGFLFPDLVT